MGRSRFVGLLGPGDDGLLVFLEGAGNFGRPIPIQVRCLVGRALLGVLQSQWVVAGLALSFSIWSLASLAHTFVVRLWDLCLYRFLLGTAEPGNFPAAVKGVSAWFPVRLSPELLARVSGPDLTIPMVTSGLDLAIVDRAAALFPPLGSDAGWGVRFGRELNASDDRAAFRLRDDGLPLVEGKHIEAASFGGLVF